ncbi:gamma-Glu-GABA hydrolase [Burkholderiales bacterium]|nr:gamma-Glu-GABA hydrolase [Burkholderiales bacterium]
MTPPYVMIPCDNRVIGGHLYYALGRKYADAVRVASDCLPLLVPTGGASEFRPYLELADGILLTGSPANVHPSHFGQELRDPALPLDEERDSVTLPLVRLAIEHGIPLLAICRGLQEVNVAMGGSLHQAIHEVPGKRDHRENLSAAPEKQYGPAHDVEIVAGSLLEQIVGERRITVNSLHGQGIDSLAPGLTAEAIAPDHVIEAVRVGAHPGFSLGVQWHPEWKVLENPVSVRIFRAFGEACRVYRLGRSRGAQSSTLPRAA